MPLWAEFMKRVYRDEHWSKLKNDTFALDRSLTEQLSCEDYLDKKPFRFRPIKRLKEKRIFQRLFRRDRR
jgi:hypothetical protein